MGFFFSQTGSSNGGEEAEKEEAQEGEGEVFGFSVITLCCIFFPF